MKTVKIYLADLTYDTVAISTEAMPLNVGFIASYCKKLFGNGNYWPNYRRCRWRSL